jgi:hypothetical protein
MNVYAAERKQLKKEIKSSITGEDIREKASSRSSR